MVRIKSILAKYKEKGGKEPDMGALLKESDREYSASETDLMLSASRFADMIEKASFSSIPFPTPYAPSPLARSQSLLPTGRIRNDTVNVFAKADFARFKELFDYDFAPLEKELGINCFSVPAPVNMLHTERLIQTKFAHPVIRIKSGDNMKPGATARI